MWKRWVAVDGWKGRMEDVGKRSGQRVAKECFEDEEEEDGVIW